MARSVAAVAGVGPSEGRPELASPSTEHEPSAKYLTARKSRPELRSPREQVRQVFARALLTVLGAVAVRDLARACGVSESVAHRWIRGETNMPLAVLSARQLPVDDRIALAWAALVDGAQTPRDVERAARAMERFARTRVDEALAKDGER